MGDPVEPIGHRHDDTGILAQPPRTVEHYPTFRVKAAGPETPPPNLSSASYSPPPEGFAVEIPSTIPLNSSRTSSATSEGHTASMR